MASERFDWRERVAQRRAAIDTRWREHLAAMDAEQHSRARRIERQLLGVTVTPMPEHVKEYFRRPDVKAAAAERARERREVKRRARAMLTVSGPIRKG